MFLTNYRLLLIAAHLSSISSAPAPAPAPRLGTSLALGALSLDLIANSITNTDGSPSVPANTNGYDPKSTCTYDSSHPAAPPSWATDPDWISSMTGCLAQLNVDNFNGVECLPNKGVPNGPVLGGTTFGFYKGTNDYDPGGADCYQQCGGCLSGAVNASQAVTTKCQYEYRTHRDVGYKTHTCTMGYVAGQ